MANSRKIKPDKIQKRGRTLAVCAHGDCLSARVWDYETCWEHLTNVERRSLSERLYDALRSAEPLSGLILSGADLEGFDFTGADLSSTFLDGCDLSNCKFEDANLRGSFLAAANLTDADLTRAEIDGTVFSGARLDNVDLAAYSLSFGRTPINLTMHSFGDDRNWRRPHINEEQPYFAEATYRALKAYFSTIGDYDSASWASYSERLMQRKDLWNRKDYLKWLVSWLFGAICGYGEKPIRAFFASAALVILYALVYQVFNLIVQIGSNVSITVIDSLYFSLATFCGYSFPDLAPKADSIARLIVTTEAFIGIFAFGLFIFTLTKRYVAR